jgi:hypothetical protein
MQNKYLNTGDFADFFFWVGGCLRRITYSPICLALPIEKVIALLILL